MLNVPNTEMTIEKDEIANRSLERSVLAKDIVHHRTVLAVAEKKHPMECAGAASNTRGQDWQHREYPSPGETHTMLISSRPTTGTHHWSEVWRATRSALYCITHRKITPMSITSQGAWTLWGCLPTWEEGKQTRRLPSQIDQHLLLFEAGLTNGVVWTKLRYCIPHNPGAFHPKRKLSEGKKSRNLDGN